MFRARRCRPDDLIYLCETSPRCRRSGGGPSMNKWSGRIGYSRNYLCSATLLRMMLDRLTTSLRSRAFSSNNDKLLLSFSSNESWSPRSGVSLGRSVAACGNAVAMADPPQIAETCPIFSLHRQTEVSRRQIFGGIWVRLGPSRRLNRSGSGTGRIERRDATHRFSR
jgi:hypothetical protein